jgi:hypothetical protein
MNASPKQRSANARKKAFKEGAASGAVSAAGTYALNLGAKGSGKAALITGGVVAPAVGGYRYMKDRKKDIVRVEVKKSLEEIIEARRRGSITSEQAINLFDKISKKSKIGAIVRGGVVRGVKDSIKASKRVKVKVPKNPIDLGRKELSSGRALAEVGGAAALTGAAGYGGYRLVRGPKEEQPVVKSDSEYSLGWRGEISKVDDDKRQVFGWCSLSTVDGQPVVDLQGDYVPLEEIEKAAYQYVVHSRKGGDMHARDGEGPKHTADLIESFLVTPEKLKHMGLSDTALPHGWWIGMKVNDDEQWGLVKNGGRTGFSIHGKGSRIEKML